MDCMSTSRTRREPRERVWTGRREPQMETRVLQHLQTDQRKNKVSAKTGKGRGFL